MERLSERSSEYEKKNERLMDEIENEKDVIEEKMKELILKSNNKYDHLQRHIDEMMRNQ